jgi:carbonic anhydrase/acetyltransferase-like protein (isoleucine patch superfamily)
MVVRRSVAINFVCLVLSFTLTMSLHAAEPTFVDPTATIINLENVHFGELVYVAPFAFLQAGSGNRAIEVGDETNIQDSVTVDARRGAVSLGEQVILAHGATVKGPASLGEGGVCDGGASHCPSFVGFNAEVDGAIIEKDAMVLHLARVAPGVIIPSGRKVLPGKNVKSQAEVAAKTDMIVAGDRVFMNNVIEVNVAFAKQYTVLAEEDEENVFGINYDPGNTIFNPNRDLPTLAGVPTRDPSFRNRIIGDIQLSDDAKTLNKVMKSQISLRADEGEPFVVGHITSMNDRVTFHALEHSQIELGANGIYGTRSLVHGGLPSGGLPGFDPTSTGTNFNLRSRAVFFSSRAGNNVTIGCKSLIQGTDLPSGTTIPSRRVIIGGVDMGTVEWGSCS